MSGIGLRFFRVPRGVRAARATTSAILVLLLAAFLALSLLVPGPPAAGWIPAPVSGRPAVLATSDGGAHWTLRDSPAFPSTGSMLGGGSTTTLDRTALRASERRPGAGVRSKELRRPSSSL